MLSPAGRSAGGCSLIGAGGWAAIIGPGCGLNVAGSARASWTGPAGMIWASACGLPASPGPATAMSSICGLALVLPAT